VSWFETGRMIALLVILGCAVSLLRSSIET